MKEAGNDTESIDFLKKKHKLIWNTNIIPFSGIPFYIVGKKVFECEFGMDRRLKYLDDPIKGRRSTKKSQCPARVVMREIVEFPDVKIPMDTMFRRCDASKRLRRLLSASVDVKYCRKIYITIPAASEHKTHPVSKRKVAKRKALKARGVEKKATKKSKRKSKIENATDTVLTTLDPGMEEYLNPVVHLAIGSQDSNIMQAIRQGFKNVFGHTAAKGHGVQHSYARLPIGFDLATKSVTEKLDAITAIDFKFNQPYVHVAIQPFLTELQQGRWSCMLCLAIRDCSKQIQLQTFSQPIQIPSQCISIAYNKTSQEVAQYGLDVDIDEAVRLYQPYANDQDWCSTLTGIKLETVITMAAQGLAAEYRRELDNPSVTNVESFVVMQ
ncbi:protein PRRC1-A-like isoform X4 [Rhopilema esculentum]|uniref:protein PRRC1-A-like isoform X4 n=1 Tax=Rhopilema esculentum TaxID=499914 RepID=UPI0031D79106